MRKQICLLVGIAVFTVLASCASAPETAAVQEAQSPFAFTEGSMQEVRDYLRRYGYYIATVDGDQPQARPFGTAAIFEEKLYIITSKAKNVSRQMTANPPYSHYRSRTQQRKLDAYHGDCGK